MLAKSAKGVKKMLQWKVAGKELEEQEVWREITRLKQDGLTGIIAIGADGACKSSVIDKMWQNLTGILCWHQYGGATANSDECEIIFDNPFGVSAVNADYRQRSITNLRELGAKHIVILWVKCPFEDGWTFSTGKAEDQVLRNNPPEHEGIVLIEAEELGHI